jgi:hypothetical protein
MYSRMVTLRAAGAPGLCHRASHQWSVSSTAKDRKSTSSRIVMKETAAIAAGLRRYSTA